MPEVPLNSVRNAMNLLSLFDAEQNQLSMVDIARRLGLTKQSTIRLLKTLEDGGFIERIPGQAKYRLALRVWEIGRNALRHSRLHECWHPIIERLVDKSGFDARLAIYDSGEAIIVDGVPARNKIQFPVRIGNRIPLHASANGKLLLAHRSEETIEETIAKGLTRYTDATITTPDRLRAELSTIRNTGISLDRGEWQASLRAVAAPVFDEYGSVAFGVGLSGLAAEIEESPIERLIHLVQQSARAISRELGAPVNREPGWNQARNG